MVSLEHTGSFTEGSPGTLTLSTAARNASQELSRLELAGFPRRQRGKARLCQPAVSTSIPSQEGNQGIWTALPSGLPGSSKNLRCCPLLTQQFRRTEIFMSVKLVNLPGLSCLSKFETQLDFPQTACNCVLSFY